MAFESRQHAQPWMTGPDDNGVRFCYSFILLYLANFPVEKNPSPHAVGLPISQADHAWY
jgi:hypothetical protein